METELRLDRATFRQLAVLMAMQGLPAIPTKRREESWADYWRRAHDDSQTRLAIALELLRLYREYRGRIDHGRDCRGPADCGVIDDDRCGVCRRVDNSGLLGNKEGR